MKDYIFSTLKNEAVMWALFSVLIFGLTQVLKIPIKHFTKKLPESKRKRVNLTIYLIPFGLGLLIAWIYYNVLPTIPALEILFNSDFWLMGLKMGTSSIAIYGIVDQFFGVKIKNPYDSEDGKKILDAVNDIMADGKASKQEVVIKCKNLTKQEQKQIENILEKK